MVSVLGLGQDPWNEARGETPPSRCPRPRPRPLIPSYAPPPRPAIDALRWRAGTWVLGELQALLVALPQPLSVCDCVWRPSCWGPAASGAAEWPLWIGQAGWGRGRPGAHLVVSTNVRGCSCSCELNACFHLRFFQFGFSQCSWCGCAPVLSLELIPRWLACLHADVASGGTCSSPLHHHHSSASITPSPWESAPGSQRVGQRPVGLGASREPQWEDGSSLKPHCACTHLHRQVHVAESPVK